MADPETPRYSPLGLSRRDTGGWADFTPVPSPDPIDEPPDAVDGVLELRAQGFAPVEEYTGALWIGPIWPEEFRAAVTETRSWWSDQPETKGMLWMVRSPWSAFDLMTCLSVVWSWAERDQQGLDENIYRMRFLEAVAWDERQAMDWAAQVGLLPR